MVWLFPLWWYGAATVDLWGKLRRVFLGDRRLLQVKLLLKNQFAPLFGGDGSWEMHIISLFIRVPLTACVLAWTAALAAGLAAVLLLWLLAPVVAAGSVLFQLGILPVSPFHFLA